MFFRRPPLDYALPAYPCLSSPKGKADKRVSHPSMIEDPGLLIANAMRHRIFDKSPQRQHATH